MKNKYLLIISLFLLLFPFSTTTNATEAGKSYAGAQYSFITYTENDIPDFNPTALVFRGGYKLNKNFAIEARFGFGLGSDSQTISGINLDLEIDNLYGAYAVGYLPVSEKLDVYGIFGVTKGKLTATASLGSLSASVTGDDSDISYGVGVDFNVTPKIAINLEYISYFSKSDFDASALSIGANYNF